MLFCIASYLSYLVMPFALQVLSTAPHMLDVRPHMLGDKMCGVINCL
jgi:hypothetical protein